MSTVGSPSCTDTTVKIMVISWNMGNAPPERSFDRIIPFGGGQYDIVAFGLQEATWSVPLKKKDEVDIADENSAEGLCVRQLLREIKDIFDEEFFLVAHNKRAQMQQLVFGRNSLMSRISNVQKTAENTGFFHVFPNKGGLRVSMTIDSTNIAFISCHLTAHEGADKCAMRNSSVAEILEGVMTTNQMHHVIFMGDMNYRCTFDKRTPADLIVEKRRISDVTKFNSGAKVPTKIVADPAAGGSDDEDIDEPMPPADKQKRQVEMQLLYEMIAMEKWDEMLELDELTRERKAQRVLVGYTSYPPAFPPTFKRVRGKAIEKRDEDVETTTTLGEAADKMAVDAPTKIFNLEMENENPSEYTCSIFYDKKRLPSFTDRILSTSLPAFNENLVCDRFFSCEEVITSDHKPVIGLFTLETTNGLHDIMAYSVANCNHLQLRYTMNTTFRLKNLSARNLSEMDSVLFGGGSDPYLVLSADPADILISVGKSKLKTKAITHDLNPQWPDIIEFRLATNDIVGLSRNAHFFLTVWDYDVTNEDDLIGTAVIALGDIFQHYAETGGESYHFSLNLIRHGLIHGQVEGDIELDTMSGDILSRRYLSHRNKTLHEDLTEKKELLHSNATGCGCNLS